jgi:hypothetical protein
LADDILKKAQVITSRLVDGLKEAGVEVLGSQPGSITDDHKGGTYAAATVTLSAEGANKLIELFGGPDDDMRNLRDALRSVLFRHHIGGEVVVSEDEEQVGLVSFTEGPAEQLMQAVLAG